MSDQDRTSPYNINTSDGNKEKYYLKELLVDPRPKSPCMTDRKENYWMKGFSHEKVVISLVFVLKII